MATLDDIKKQLVENKKSTDDTAEAVNQLHDLMQFQFDYNIQAASSRHLEDLERQKELTNALGNLRGGGGPSGPAGGSGGSANNFDLGGVGTGLAVAIGTVIGVIKGQLKAIRVFFEMFTPGLVRVFDDFKANVAGRLSTIAEAFKTKFTTVFSSIGSYFDDVFNWVKTIFTISEDSNLGKVIGALKTALSTFIDPFETAIKTLLDLLPEGGKLTEKFSAVKGLLGSFGGTISTVAKTVGKIFAPLAIVMTAIDTIKGAIDGYAEDGIWGGIQGAIDGLFNSLIFGPADLVKNITAWVLDKIGFDNASKFLSSFSFVDIFDTITDKLFGGIKTIVTFVGDNFILMKDIIVATFSSELTKVVNGFKKAFASIGVFINNIPDQLYLLISKNLRFGLPEIKIPIPDWLGGGDFTLLSGFEVGVGDAASQAKAQERINARNSATNDYIAKLDQETNAKIVELQRLQRQLAENFNKTFVVQSNTTNNVSSSTTQQVNPSQSWDDSWYRRKAMVGQGF